MRDFPVPIWMVNVAEEGAYIVPPVAEMLYLVYHTRLRGKSKVRRGFLALLRSGIPESRGVGANFAKKLSVF